MTWLFIIAFVLLITVIGAGFDVFLTIDAPVRFLMLPFALLMLGSGIWNFRHRAAEGLWKEPQAFADDDDRDDILNRWLLKITLVAFLLLFFLLAFFLILALLFVSFRKTLIFRLCVIFRLGRL